MRAADVSEAVNCHVEGSGPDRIQAFAATETAATPVTCTSSDIQRPGTAVIAMGISGPILLSPVPAAPRREIDKKTAPPGTTLSTDL